MKVAIVNDMRMAREVLRRVVALVPDATLAWMANDGAEAVEKCAENRPDVILMDLLMPVMDGAEATRRIMQATPCAILVVTATVEGNFSKVYQAMGYGALDAVNTPVIGISGGVEGAEAFTRKLETIRSLISGSLFGEPDLPSTSPRSLSRCGDPILLIGASTGGPQAVADLLALLPADFPAPVVLIQHVDKQFAEGLASWLKDRTALPVSIASSGSPLRPGTVLVAGTNDHLIINANHTIGYTPFPQEMPYRPSVDVAFRSVAKHWTGRGCAVLLTGMGRDGAEGLLTLRNRGFLTLAQDEASCVVYGMPKAAAELGACELVLPVAAMAEPIQKHLTLETPFATVPN